MKVRVDKGDNETKNYKVTLNYPYIINTDFYMIIYLCRIRLFVLFANEDCSNMF
ncbi:hypothetical protein GCM10008935_26550 [Alkalibacillus silvisoli]|uniref:Uncharacterized protein n=1 Tax=Alkalibacillus silvisoli TaxID=392823 RepID=A0ABN1A7D1_9BACI